MKFISWNVNGLRACVNKGFLDFFHEINADAFCIQEKDRLTFPFRAITSTGIMRRKKAIPALPSLPKRNLFL